MQISLSELIDAVKPTVNHPDTAKHPLCGKPVLVASAHGFVHTGILDQEGPYLFLRQAANVRFWSKREGGLPELARDGYLEDDKIDPCDSDVYLSSIVFMMERNP